jgi:hypothetical protein
VLKYYCDKGIQFVKDRAPFRLLNTAATLLLLLLLGKVLFTRATIAAATILTTLLFYLASHLSLFPPLHPASKTIQKQQQLQHFSPSKTNCFKYLLLSNLTLSSHG